MWLLLLRKFWPYLLAAALVIGAGVWLHHRGYESGFAASEANWKPRFDAAERARDTANARADALQLASKHLSDEYESRHAQTVASLTARAADAEQRTAGLVRQLSARSRCSTLPPSSGSSPVPDATPASDPIADRASKDLVELARRCESDARTLAELQDWVTDQRAIFSGRPPGS